MYDDAFEFVVPVGKSVPDPKQIGWLLQMEGHPRSRTSMDEEVPTDDVGEWQVSKEPNILGGQAVLERRTQGGIDDAGICGEVRRIDGIRAQCLAAAVTQPHR